MFDVSCLKELDSHFLDLGFQTKSSLAWTNVAIECLDDETSFKAYLSNLGLNWRRNHKDYFLLEPQYFPKLYESLVEYGSIVQDMSNCPEHRCELTKDLALLESQIVYGNQKHLIAFVRSTGEAGLLSDLRYQELGFLTNLDAILYPIEDPNQLDTIIPQLRNVLLMLKEVFLCESN